ncbi:putative glucose dehydrogenase [Lindgomyces ingoldianus]|uniref:Glucose dehydrogenase n=1 Tax=Lindgomyces ingoldianus TaxID=673940 RepID=A0ACB6QNT4_9PLEO|nr:putative glucose dehydrogenase [Lindgomyces ingoldianus]KAF2467780.1 putative glucose dehydrogenase [Lindgomyces ingoldianus]
MYDFIIIGGGTAGSVLASRLAKPHNSNPSTSPFHILILEAGPNTANHPHTAIPWESAALHGSKLDWNYRTVPQVHLDGKPRYNCAVKGLGGGTVINSGGWIRGDRRDYDDWARVVGDERWSYEGMLKYFKRSERHWDSSVDAGQHGFEGPIYNSSPSSSGRKYPLREEILEAWKSLGFEEKRDGNDGNPQGIAELVENWREGRRQIASQAYGLEGVEVVTDVLVRRVMLSSEVEGTSAQRKAVGVECADGATYLLKPGGEVVVSAGAYRTPQILLLSGIGEPAELDKHGIKTEVELPDVGKNFHDHMIAYRYWKLRNPDRGLAAGSPLFNDPAYIKGGPLDWLVSIPVSAEGLRTAIARDEGNSAEVLDQHPLVKGPRTHVELSVLYAVFGGEQVGLKLPVDGTAIMTFLMPFLPTSRGSVTLRSAHPEDSPVIDPNYYATETDRYVAREGWRTLSQLMQKTPQGKGIVSNEIVPEGYGVDDEETDGAIDARLKIGGVTAFHPAGTASMGKVVDGSLKIPKPLASHYQVAVYAIAEQAADIILRDHK